MSVQWKVYLDWDNDGDFDDAYEDITAYAMDLEFQYGMSKPFQVMGDENILRMRLTNADGRFNPEGTAGPYYGEMLPRRRVKVDAITSGGTSRMFYGYVDSYRPDPGGNFTRVASITARGIKHLFEDASPNIELLQNKRTDEIVSTIVQGLELPPAAGESWLLGVTGFSEVGESTRLSDLDDVLDFEEGLYTAPFAGDNFTGSLYDAIGDVVASEHGRFFISRGGTAVFWNRRHTQAVGSASGTLQYVTGGMYESGINLDGDTSGVNSVEMQYTPRSVEVDELLWSLGTATVVPALTTLNITAKYRQGESGAQVGADNVYGTAFAGGAGITWSVSAEGQRATISFINNNSGPGTVTAFEVYGDKITTFDVDTIIEDNEENALLYGKRVYRSDMPLVTEAQHARDAALWSLAERGSQDGRFNSVNTISRGDDSGHDEFMITTDVGSVIEVSDETLDHQSDYLVTGAIHRVTDSLKSHQVTYNVEPVGWITAWRVGESELDTNTRLAF